MTLHGRSSPFARYLVLLAGIAAIRFAVPTASETFAPFVPQTPPQRALGDFDGDGRIDTALIQEWAGEKRISIQLSGSPGAVGLDAPVTGVVEGDIDHDGDLDLVAATPSGDVLIWLNDGHGRFTRQVRAQGRSISGEPSMIQAAWPESMAVGTRAPLVLPPARAQTKGIVTKARPPTDRVAVHARCPILQIPRAPPALST